jgi:hypothetical protein
MWRCVHIRLTQAKSRRTFLAMHYIKKRGQKERVENRQEITSLLKALNGEWPKKNISSPSPRHVMLLAPNVVRLAGIVLKLQSLVTNPPRVDLAGLKDIREYIHIPAARHLAQLNSVLERYNSVPGIGTDLKGNWHFNWSVRTRGYGDEDEGIFDFTASEEFPLVLTAVRLAEQGLIDRVRRCPIDRRWFYGRTRESRFCSSKCRDTFHQRDPARKAKRRDYARELYKLHKTKNVK